MPPLLKQQNSATSAGLGTSSDGYVLSQTVNLGVSAGTSAVAVGDFLFLVVNLSGTGVTLSSVTDNRSHTWSKWAAASIPSTGTGTDQSIEVWTTTATVANTITVTATAGSAGQFALNLRAYSGIDPTGTRVTAATAVDANFQLSHTVGTTASAGNGDLVITGINVARANEIFSSGNGYGNMATMGSATGLQYLSAAVQDRNTSAPGPQSASFGTAQYDKGVLFIAVLKNHVTAAPAPPTDVLATAGNTAASLSWTASPGADTYTVQRGTSASGPFTTVASGISVTNYTQTGLTNGTTYFYRVAAVNGVGTSSYTNAAGVTPATSTNAPFLDWYAYGVKPSYSATAMRQAFRQKVDAWFSFVLTNEYTPGTPIPPNPRFPGAIRRIKAPNQGFYSPRDPGTTRRNGTVSEGQAYGALFCAWLSNPSLATGVYWPEARAYFDSLYRFYDLHKNERGLMNWHIWDNGEVGDYNGATDGDFDMAEALRVMSEIHGDAGAINYGAECDKLLKAIEDYEFVPETGYAYPNLQTCGDGWGFNADVYMADYARVGFWREWSKWLRKRGRVARADRWERFLTVNYDHIQYYMDSAAYTAGVPDRQTRTYGTMSPTWDKITYNSVRLGFGFMVDYLWNGPSADSRAKAYMDKITDRIKAVFTTGSNVKALDWTGNLSSYEGYSNLVGWAYALSVALGKSENQTFATQLYDSVVGSNEYISNYFNGGLGVYALGVVSGAAQPFTRAGTTNPENPTNPTDPATPPATNPSKTTAVYSYWNASLGQWVQVQFTTTVS